LFAIRPVRGCPCTLVGASGFREGGVGARDAVICPRIQELNVWRAIVANSNNIWELESDVPQATVSPSLPGVVVGNIGEPIRLTGVELCGVSAEHARANEQVKIWTRLALTSDDPVFHKIASNLASVIEHHASKVGVCVRLNRAEIVLMIIKADNSAELWIDTAAVSLRCMVERNVTAGTAVFESDIADITGMSFPCVEIIRTDKVLCLFRQDWRFAFYFDFNPDQNVDLENFTATLGTLYRTLQRFL
jgi:hypothetical protein